MVRYLIAILIFFLVTTRMVMPLKCSKKTKLVLIFLVLIVSQFYSITRWFYGNLVVIEWPTPLLTLAYFLFIGLLFLSVLLIIKEILGLIFKIVIFIYSKLFHTKPKLIIPKKYWIIFLLFISLTLSGTGLYEAMKVPEINTVNITLNNLPSELNGLKIVQISDIHVSPLLRGSRVTEIVNKTNNLKPDFIILTGDMVDGTVANRYRDVLPLKNLKAPLGVYAIMGNHEYYSGYRQWLKTFKELGFEMLINSHKVLEKNGKNFILAGVTDLVAERFGEEKPDTQKALNQSDPNLFSILLSHRPDSSAIFNSSQNIDLQLSGHTHGRQINIASYFAPARNINYLKGLYQINNMILYVSTGAGLWNGFPVRIGVPSEIAEIILVKEKK